MLERVCRTAIQDIEASHERGCRSKEDEDRTHTLSLTCITRCLSQTLREWRQESAIHEARGQRGLRKKESLVGKQIVCQHERRG